MRTELPTGTVTFLFTDVEGSTRLLHELGPEGYAQALAEHRRVVREACAAQGGVEVDTQGDAFFVAFPTAPGALAAAASVLEGLVPGPIRVRMGLHTGTPHVGEEGYVGVDVHRAARIASAGHGGQVLVSAATAALAGTDGLRDLGEHRLKDLSAPERLYQLGSDEFPPLKSLHQTNLPVPATPFLGRDRELHEIGALLAGDGLRLLTLTGPGGTGKTRLALQAAAAAADRHPHGVWWVPLAALRDPELVLPGAAQALGAKDDLAEHIADRSLLLLLDNFEHLLDAAAGVAELLARCPNLQLLVTSREPLRITGEQEYAVPPLAHAESVDFFAARARAVKPDFEPDGTVDEICRRLDELPLALELAAARVKALSPAQILQRLEQRLPLLTGGARDLPERQRTLRAAIEWSHDLLTPDEQELFARLAVFRGGCTLEAAEQIAGADLDTIRSLVDKSLLRHNEDRYWMLETIRELAAERLGQRADATTLRQRHADFFLALAEEAETPVREHSREWIDRVDAEYDNIRAAFDWFEATQDTQSGLRLAGALGDFAGIRGHFVEARRRVEQLLAADDRRTPARAKALTAAADLADGTERERAFAREALELQRELGDSWGVAVALLLLGDSYAAEAEFERARELWEESAGLFAESDDVYDLLLVNRLLGWAYSELGDVARGRALQEENLRRAREGGLEHMEAQALEALAVIEGDAGRAREATKLLVESLRIHRRLDDPFRVAVSVCRFARVLAFGGDAALGARLLGCGEALLDELGSGASWVVTMNAETREQLLTQLDDDALVAARRAGEDLTADAAIDLAVRALEAQPGSTNARSPSSR